MAMDFSQYRFKPLNDDQANEAADIIATGLGLGLPTGKQSMTWDDYQNWWLAALNDGKLKRKEWRDLGDRAGFRGKDARKAFKKGGIYWQKYLNETIKPKLQKNSYIYRDPTTGKVSLISQGDMNYDPEAYANAYYKGTDSTKLANDFNKALADARKNAKITYKQGKDGKWGYFTSYKVGDFAVDDLDVSNSDWFKLDANRQKNAQLLAYKDAVDKSYADNQGTEYLGEDGLNLLKKIGYKNIDEVKNYGNLKDTDEDKAKKDTIRQNVSSALQKYFDTMAKNSKGEYSWNESAKADATWKHLMDYYNGKNIAWLGQLDWRDKSRYSGAMNITPNTTIDTSGVAGSLIGLHKEGGNLKARVMAKGGMIPKRSDGGDLLKDAASLVIPGVDAYRLYKDGKYTDAALSAALDIAGFAAGGFAGKAAWKLGTKAFKYLSRANKAARKSAAIGKDVAKLKESEKAIRELYNISKKTKPEEALKRITDPEHKEAFEKITKKINNLTQTQKSYSNIITEATKKVQKSAVDQIAQKNLHPVRTFLKNGTKTALKVVPAGITGAAVAETVGKNLIGSSGQPTEEAATQQAKQQAAQQASESLQPGDTYVDEAGNTNVVNADGTTSVVAGDEYNSATYRVINKQGGILKSLDNKYFKKGGKLKSKYGIIKNS